MAYPLERTPLDHAASHAAAGSDPLTLSTSQVSGLGGAATLSVGTTAGTVAAGDDSRIAGARVAPRVPLVSGRWSGPGTPSGTLALTAARLYLVPFICTGGTLDRIAANVTVGAASSVIRYGLYSSTGYLPDARVADFGTVDSSGTGVLELTISQAVSADTLYWLALVTVGGTPTVTAISASPVVASTTSSDLFVTLGAYRHNASVTGALPANISTPTATSSGPRITVRAT